MKTFTSKRNLLSHHPDTIEEEIESPTYRHYTFSKHYGSTTRRVRLSASPSRPRTLRRRTRKERIFGECRRGGTQYEVSPTVPVLRGGTVLPSCDSGLFSLDTSGGVSEGSTLGQNRVAKRREASEGSTLGQNRVTKRREASTNDETTVHRTEMNLGTKRNSEDLNETFYQEKRTNYKVGS